MFLNQHMIYVMIKFMKKIGFFILTVIFLFLNTSLKSEIVKDIKVVGNERISSQTIVVLSNINEGDDLNKNSLNIVIKNLYETDFFKDIQVELNNNILLITVKENPIIQEVVFQGIKREKLKEVLYDNIKLKNKNSFVEYYAKKDKDLILNILQQLGYYFAKIETKISENDNNTINLIYDVNLGEKAIIKQIKFTGNKIFKDKKLLELIASETDKFWKILSKKKYFDPQRINFDVRLLKNYYLNKGYYNVKVDSTSASFVKDNEFILTYNIDAGEKFFFNKINLILPDDFDANDFKEIENKSSKIENTKYSLRSIEKLLKEIDKNVLTSQFKFINAKYKETIIDENKINLDIFFDESKKYYVNRINILGNSVTREEVIRNKIIVDEGDPFNEILFKKGINNIKSLNFFKSVEYVIKPTSDPQKNDIDIIVQEKPTGEISAGAGVGTSGSTIGISVKENNYLGKGIGLQASLSLSEEQLKGRFAVDNPNFMNTGKALTTVVESTTTDKMSDSGYKTSKTGFSFGTRYEQFENLFFSPSVSTYYETLETTDDATTSLQKQEGDYFDTSFSYALDYDLRDSSFRPTDGLRSKFIQTLPIVSDEYSIINGYEYSQYYEFENKAVTSFKFWSRAANSLTGDDVRVSQRVFVPSRRLRGFEAGKIGPKDNADFIGGNYATAMTLSTSLPQLLSSLESTDISVFLDAANVWGVDYDSSINDSNKIRSSIGAAIDVATPIGPLSFSFTQPVTKKHTDNTETFRFQIGTTF